MGSTDTRAAPRFAVSCPLRCRVALLVALGLLSLAAAGRTAVLTPVPAWPWLLLLAALLAPAVFVELPLCVGNHRVPVAELYEAALLVALSLRTGVWLALVTAVVTVLRDNYLHRSHRRDAEAPLGARPPRVWGGRPLGRPPALVQRRVAARRCCRRRGSCAARSSHARVTLMHAASAPPWIKQSDIPRSSNE